MEMSSNYIHFGSMSKWNCEMCGDLNNSLQSVKSNWFSSSLVFSTVVNIAKKRNNEQNLQSNLQFAICRGNAIGSYWYTFFKVYIIFLSGIFIFKMLCVVGLFCIIIEEFVVLYTVTSSQFDEFYDFCNSNVRTHKFCRTYRSIETNINIALGTSNGRKKIARNFFEQKKPISSFLSKSKMFCDE